MVQNDVRALHFFQLAADQGNAYAHNSLGISYELGAGVAQDKARALELFQKAAD